VPLGVLVSIAPPSRLSGQQMNLRATGAHFQAHVNVVLGLVEVVPLQGALGGMKVVLRPGINGYGPHRRQDDKH
jgi:hypothetical protein